MELVLNKTQTRLCHGQAEVLRIICELPEGDTPMEQHLRALADALCTYARETLLPAAQTELERAVRSGWGHTFYAHRYRICVTCEHTRHGDLVTLLAEHKRGRECVSSERLLMCWSEDGGVQRPVKRAKKNPRHTG